MSRSLRAHGHRVSVLALLLLLSSCGGDAEVETRIPPRGPGGPAVAGQVLLPDGQLAQSSSLLERFAADLIARVQALVAENVDPAPNVGVELVLIGPDDVSGGEIVGGGVTDATDTNEFGQYQVQLNRDTTAEECRYLVRVGAAENGTLTRAFVFSTTAAVDISFQSEATVRLILEQIAAGNAGLCDFSAADIASIYGAVVDSDQVVSGNTIAELNAAATSAAASDPNVQAAIQSAIGQPTVVPATATDTPLPTATATPVSNETDTPTQTITPRPTRTDTPTPGPETPTVEPTATSSVEPTATPSATSSVTVTATVPPTGTRTATVPLPTATGTVNPPTATVPPTVSPVNTSTHTPTNTPTPTHTPTNTATPTLTPTNTQPPTPTDTPAGGPEVNLGLVSGTTAVFSGAAGAMVEVPVSLAADGVSISAVSNDIEFDGALLDVRMVKGVPDCALEPGLMATERLFAAVADLEGNVKRLRVGLVGQGSNAELPDGVLYRCRFEIDIDAPSGSIALSNLPGASSPTGGNVPVGGNDGRIDVSAAGPALGLSAGTASAGETIAVTATLHARGAVLSAVATDIEFDPTLVTVNEGEGGPDCEVAASIGSETVFNKEVFSIVRDVEGSSMQVLRVGLAARDNNAELPEEDGASQGTEVFTCRFVVQAASGAISLQQSASGSDPSGQEIGLVGEPGTIMVQ